MTKQADLLSTNRTTGGGGPWQIIESLTVTYLTFIHIVHLIHLIHLSLITSLVSIKPSYFDNLLYLIYLIYKHGEAVRQILPLVRPGLL